MTNTLTYAYHEASLWNKTESRLFLSDYSEVRHHERFFFGEVLEPFILSRCLLVLSNTVRSRFTMTPQDILNKDPIVSVGNATLRFEGFSDCAGVYVRTDVLSDGFRGELLANGTTNVDFNAMMIAALGGVTRNDDLNLSIGKDDVQIKTGDKTITERKVPLPDKWIKGLTSVQHYLAHSTHQHTLNKVQTLQLFRSIPKGTIKNDYYVIKRGNRYQFSPANTAQTTDAIVIGGLHRLHLLTPLLPLLNSLKIFSQRDNQSVTLQLYFPATVLSFTLSRDVWRGFSGEGVLLEALLEDLPNELVETVNHSCQANQRFSDFSLPMQADVRYEQVENLTAKLSAMGLLGFELDSNDYFYRQLPFKLSRILSLNPRLKGVEKLLQNNKVRIVSQDDNRIEAQVDGSGVTHTVILHDTARCTCTWFSQNQGERGACKHILAVKKLVLS